MARCGYTDMIVDESKMCFATVANRPYQHYIPWWLYFLDQAYPKSHKVVFLDGPVVKSIAEILATLSGSFEIKENAFDEYTKVDDKIIRCLRWLILDPMFEQFDCLSMGDVDMAICKESPSYMEQHLSHCELLEIPYSNCIRAKTKPARMGGIHVIKPKEWFEVMTPIIEKYRSEFVSQGLKHRVLQMGKGFNEQFLLKMIIESDLGAVPTNLSSTYWTSLVTSAHHGIHIRLAELTINKLKKSKGYLSRKSEFLAACENPLFDHLVGKLPKIGVVLNRVRKSYSA